MGQAAGGWGQVLGTWRGVQLGESCLGERCQRRTEWTLWASLTVFFLRPHLETGGATARLVKTSQGPVRLPVCALQARAKHPPWGPFWAQTALLGPNLPRATCGDG